MTNVTIHGERGDEWERICGTREFPVISPLPVRGSAPGVEAGSFYQLDLDAMDVGLLDRILTHLCDKFQVPREEGEAHLREVGIPILADGCSMMTDNPALLFAALDGGGERGDDEDDYYDGYDPDGDYYDDEYADCGLMPDGGC